MSGLIAGALLSVNVYGQGDRNSAHMDTGMQMGEMNSASMFLMDLSSGTAMNPSAWPMPMVMKSFGSWNAMFMGEGFIVDTQQSGPRGGDKLYSLNWVMGNFEHRLGEKGAFQTQVMLSLEPATITDRRYPLLFQTGETAFGKPIVDGQHPHNFIMGLGFQYARAVSENATLELYFAPVGDPALGPVAYPHRASAAELPQATLSHHWQDSTHIADEVVTGGSPTKRSKWRRAASMDQSRMKTGGVFKLVQLTRGRRGCGGFRLGTGRRKYQSGDSLARKRSSRAIRSAAQDRLSIRKHCRAGAGHPVSSGVENTARQRNGARIPIWWNLLFRSAAKTSSRGAPRWWTRTSCFETNRILKDAWIRFTAGHFGLALTQSDTRVTLMFLATWMG
ncbi:MAG: hypothetical protein ACR2IV_01845 [Bryobacteraceae bacterium]